MIRLVLLVCGLLSFAAAAITPGAEQPDRYMPLLEGKQVSLVVNHTAQTRQGHLLDSLLKNNVEVVSIMSPEHGFRGDAAAGHKVTDGVDLKTGLPVHSLYGRTKKPTRDMLSNVDVMVFDIQDVGARFYTYLSTLHYVLEAGAEHAIEVIVLDRPNPHIAHVDGPILKPQFQSFVGMHAIPVLHGMTLGELARMIKGEGWVANAEKLKLSVIPVNNYQRTTPYTLPIPPSPNLPNARAVALYPTLCFFEGTAVSIGRGTDRPFQLIGHPSVALGSDTVLVTGNDAAPYARYKGRELKARLLTADGQSGIDLALLTAAFKTFERAGTPFFTRPAFFDKLAGTDALRLAIEAGKSSEAIRADWQTDLDAFRAKRAPYLIYAEAP